MLPIQLNRQSLADIGASFPDVRLPLKTDITRYLAAATGNVDPQMPPKRFSRQSVREYDAKSSLLLGPRFEASKPGQLLREIGPHRPTATCSRSIRQNVAVLAV